MSASDRLLGIGVGRIHERKRGYIRCYLGWSRAEVLTDWILRYSGSLAPTENDFVLPTIKFLPADAFWPERYVLNMN
jgi:hypothetical protein